MITLQKGRQILKCISVGWCLEIVLLLEQAKLIWYRRKKEDQYELNNVDKVINKAISESDTELCLKNNACTMKAIL